MIFNALSWTKLIVVSFFTDLSRCVRANSRDKTSPFCIFGVYNPSFLLVPSLFPDLALEVDVSNELTRKLPDVTLFKTNRAKAEKKKADSSAPASSLLLQQQQQPPASIALSDGSGKKSKKIASTVQVVKPNVDTVKMINNVRPNPDHIVKQLSNGHTLMKLVKTRVRGFCVSCIRKMHDPEYKKKLEKIITYCSACPASEWSCVNCFDESHGVGE